MSEATQDFYEELKEFDFNDSMEQLRFSALQFESGSQFTRIMELLENVRNSHDLLVLKYSAQVGKLLERSQAEFEAHGQKVYLLDEQLTKRLAMIEGEKDICADLRLENSKLKDTLSEHNSVVE